MKKYFSFFVLLFCAFANAQLAQQEVYGLLYSSTGCTSGSRALLDIGIIYNGKQESAALISVLSGLEVYDRSTGKTNDWANGAETLPLILPVENRRFFDVRQRIIFGDRNSSLEVKAINYVWKKRFQNGRTEWDKGNQSPLGYYRASLAGLKMQCHRRDAAWQQLKVTAVSK